MVEIKSHRWYGVECGGSATPRRYEHDDDGGVEQEESVMGSVRNRFHSGTARPSS